MRKNFSTILIVGAALLLASCVQQKESFSPVDYVNPLMGTESTYAFSHGNTYPAVAVPWGMNFWSPQTGENGSGWMYTYTDSLIRGFRQTHQPSPWINDYGTFSIMPLSGVLKMDHKERGSTFLTYPRGGGSLQLQRYVCQRTPDRTFRHFTRSGIRSHLSAGLCPVYRCGCLQRWKCVDD